MRPLHLYWRNWHFLPVVLLYNVFYFISFWIGIAADNLNDFVIYRLKRRHV